MERVAAHLVKHVLKLADLSERDVFARSAFNRYYYAAFHRARNMYRQMYPLEPVPKHKQFPETIEKDFFNIVKKQAKKQAQAKVISYPEAMRMVNEMRKLSSEFPNLLRTAYHVRCVADYDTEPAPVCTPERIELDGVDINAAQRWPERAEVYAKQILSIWRRLGI